MAVTVGKEHTYGFVNQMIAGLFFILRLKITVRGADHLPSAGSAVIACNHTSYLDFTFVGYVAHQRARHVRFMCKRSIFNSRFAGPLMRAMGHIPVDRPSGAVAYRIAQNRLRDSQIICTFPEATISHSFVLRPMKTGAAALAIDQQVPLIPAIVWGSHRIATVDRRFSLRPGIAVSVILGPPLHPEAGEDRFALTDRLHERMELLLDEAIDTYPQRPRREADRWWLPAHKGGTAPDGPTGLRLDHEGLERIGELID